MSESKSLLYRLTHAPLRKYWLFLMLVLAVIPVVRPLLLPVYISPQTRDFYNKIMELPPGSVVLIGMEITTPPVDLRTAWDSLVSTMFERDLKLIFLNFEAGGEVACEYIIEWGHNPEKYNLKYGEDYVIMPYLAGEEAAMAAAAADFWSAYSTDYYGNPLDELPIFKNVRSIKDVDLAIAYYHIFTFGEMYVRQWPVKYGVPLLVIGQFYGIAPYYGTYVLGNIDATLRAWAEWEYLVGKPGEELTRLDAQNLQGACALVFVFVPLIAWLVRTGGREREKIRVARGF